MQSFQRVLVVGEGGVGESWGVCELRSSQLLCGELSYGMIWVALRWLVVVGVGPTGGAFF